jgi:hypothetical protein
VDARAGAAGAATGGAGSLSATRAKTSAALDRGRTTGCAGFCHVCATVSRLATPSWPAGSGAAAGSLPSIHSWLSASAVADCLAVLAFASHARSQAGRSSSPISAPLSLWPAGRDAGAAARCSTTRSTGGAGAAAGGAGGAAGGAAGLAVVCDGAAASGFNCCSQDGNSACSRPSAGRRA